MRLRPNDADHYAGAYFDPDDREEYWDRVFIEEQREKRREVARVRRQARMAK